ncbi:MAG TPA: amidase family protein [Streptosporangiaceae bacterium]|nr:amidase family protein [Streptosporangiaceae bacterium]
MDLCSADAVALARMLRNRELSARELLTAFLARVDEINPLLNALVTLDAERAIARAAELDEQAARGEFAGPLHGLPIAIKDLAETKGLRTTYGSPLFADYVPDFDAPHVALLRAAGVVIFGKTNTPEFGAGSQTFNRVFGATRNPRNPALTPGGSSGGAAAAVASGMLPFADGSDLAASVRNPASFCGLVGLRPTPGLIPADTLEPLAVVGPLARSAADAALLLAGMCGADSGLPFARPDRPASFLDLRPAEPRGLRVAWTEDLGDLPVSAEVRSVLSRFRSLLEASGCEVVEDHPPLSGADDVFQVLRAVLMASFGGLVDQVKETLAWNIRKGLALTGPQIAAAKVRQAEIFSRMKDFLASGYDVLALPTVQVPPFPVEQEWVTSIEGVPQETYIDWVRSCSRITVTLHPAVSVPAGFTAAGLPVGVQLVGAYGADLTLLRIAATFESLAPRREGTSLVTQTSDSTLADREV